jgi:hypothetical protein
MSDPQTQQQDQKLTTIVTAASAVVLAAFMGAQLALLTRFAALIARYGSGDLLRFALRRAAKDVATQLQAETPALVAQVVGRAVAAGARAGGPGEPVDPTFGVSGDSFESHAERSARAIREDLTGKLNGLGYRITRYADDIYQAVQVDASISQVLGSTPAKAQSDAYRALTRRGVDGFTDSRGRKWELSAYVEMAVRTAAQRAFNVSHLDRMRSLGIELFTVTDDGNPCPLCAPWQGKILSVDYDPRADATIADATAAGLFHNNCKHELVAFFPGVTQIPAPHEWNAADQHAYDESQRQRKLERDIRAAKRELAGAYTPEQKALAQQSLRQAFAIMRAFIDSSGRVRNTRREQLDLGAK